MAEGPITSCGDLDSKDRFLCRKQSLQTEGQITSYLESWLCSYGLKSRDETSSSCHEPHIQHGYRPNPSKIQYCLKSVFHPTNETLNVWTHALPCIGMAYHYKSFADQNLEDLTDPLLYPYWFFVAGVIFTLFGSSCAHMFNCLSPGTREVCFCCDYGVIALHAIGLTCSFTFYLCPYSCVTSQSGSLLSFYLTIMLGNIFSVIGACLTRYPNIPYRFVVRITPYVMMYTLLNIPCAYKYTLLPGDGANVTVASSSSDVINPACQLSMSPASARHFKELSLIMLLSATVQGLKLPERWFPGFFDIVGHSHQIFHLLTASGMCYQSVLIERSILEAISMQKSGLLTPEDLEISWLTAFFIPAVTAISCCLAALYYSTDLYNHHRKAKAS